MELFGTLSKRNAVCVGELRGVAAKSGVAPLETFKEKQVKKKEKNEIATTYNLIPNNSSFIEYIKLISAVPYQWQLNSAIDNERNEFIENVLQKSQMHDNSSKPFMAIFFQKQFFCLAKSKLVGIKNSFYRLAQTIGMIIINVILK